MLSNFLILVAGGRGLRRGSDLPKQFMLLAGEPVIMRTIRRFVEAMPGIGIVVVLHPDYVDMWHRLCEEHGFDISVRIVRGGEERFHSVKNGLDAISSSAGDDIVAVHDAVRPLVSVEVIRRTFAEAVEHGAVVPALPSVESVRLVDAGGRSMAVSRNSVMLVQTPQVFSLSLLRKAYAQPYRDTFTDDASVVEALGHPIHVVPGNRENIKLTTPLDMQMAEMLV